MTSGLIYAGELISYKSWAVTVPTETRPPVPGCFVIVKLPSSSISAIG